MTARTSHVRCAMAAAITMSALNATLTWAGIVESSETRTSQSMPFVLPMGETKADAVASEYAAPAWVDPSTTAEVDPVTLFNMIVAEDDINMSDLGDLTNHRGRRVSPARLPYFYDFEFTMVGAEWKIEGLESKRGLGQFAGPFAVEPQYLDIETSEGAAYLLTFDLYLLNPGEGSTMFVEVDGEVMYEESFRSLGKRADTPLDVDVPVIEGLRVGFSATTSVTELTFGADGKGGQVWGIDNVQIEVLPMAMLSANDAGGEAGGGGSASPQPRKAPSPGGRGAKVRSNRGGRGGSSSSAGVVPFEDLTGLFDEPIVDPADAPITIASDPGPVLDELDDDPTPTPTPTDPDDDLTSTTPDRPSTPPGGGGTDPEAPAPGGLALFGISAGGLMRRRR